MRRDEFVRRFIAVHKCGGCGQILDFEYSDGALCPECKIKWNKAIIAECRQCFAPICDCMCMPKRLSASGALCHRKLFEYKKDSAASPEMRVLYLHKHMKISRITKFIADELLPAVREEMSVLSENPEDFLICYVPRGRRAYRVHGFDQSRRLACELSKALGVPFADAFTISFFAKSQKQLNAKQRMQNAKRSIRLKSNACVSEKHIILVDDIVTTGSQMSVCTSLLKRAAAREVLCFSAATENKM